MWLWVIGAVLAVFGAVSAITGRIALVDIHDSIEGVTSTAHFYPGADTASAWMWTGIIALILGFAILIVKLFFFGHSSRKD